MSLYTPNGAVKGKQDVEKSTSWEGSQSTAGLTHLRPRSLANG